MTAILLDRPAEGVSAAAPLRATDAISRADFQEIRRRMALDFCKWDPQVADVSTLAPFALMMPRATWQELADAAECLSRETLELERALLQRPDLQRRIGVPGKLRQLLNPDVALTPAAARVMRYDFHLTDEGWRISEVNSDVPGGFAEASAFTSLMAEQIGGEPTGDPGAAYADALTLHGGNLVLLSAAGFLEDQQVVAGLAQLLEQRGCGAFLAQPEQLRWRDGHAFLDNRKIDAIVRFYQAEWLCRLPRRMGWQNFFVGGRTPIANPGIAVLSESKRLPLVWEELGVPLPAWRRYLPETRDPREVAWRNDDGWLLKTTYCNTGDTVTLHESATPRQRFATWLDVLLHPRQWIAQRRFRTLPLDTPCGEMFPCIGVYTIDGRACGIYGRLSRGPVVNYQASDVAVLIEERG